MDRQVQNEDGHYLYYRKTTLFYSFDRVSIVLHLTCMIV